MADQQQTQTKLGYSVKEAVGLTPYGYDRLLAFIESGELPARRSVGEKGRPGKYVILHADLVKFLEGLPVA